MDSSKNNFFKILVVGEQHTGKTSLIKMIHNWQKFADKKGQQPESNKGSEFNEDLNEDAYQEKLLTKMTLQQE